MKDDAKSTRVSIQNVNQKKSATLIFEWVLIFGAGGVISGGLGGGIVHTIPGTHGEGEVLGALLGAIKGGIASALLGAFGKLIIVAINTLGGKSSENLIIDHRDKEEMPGQGRSSRLLLLIRRFWAALENGRWLPMLLFVMSCICMWFIRGVHHGGDTARYLRGAEQLLSGQPIEGVAGAYIGYVVFVAGVELLGLGEIGIILTQIAVSAICMFALYDMGRRFAGEMSGILAASLYAINLDMARFTFAILTDSLYTSGIVLSVYLTYRALNSSKPWIVLAGLVVLFTASIRPGGALIIPVFGAFIIFGAFNGWSFFRRLFLALLVIPIAVALYVGPMVTSYGHVDPMKKLIAGEVVYGHKGSRLPMPGIAQKSDKKIITAIDYCANYPAACSGLFFRRIMAFYGHTRTFYSFQHNLFILTTFLPLYTLAALGFAYRFRDSLTWLVLTVIGLQTVFFGLNGVDWDGRFLTYIFPLITFYSAIGAVVVGNWTHSLFKEGSV